MTPIRLWSTLVIHSLQRYGTQPLTVTKIRTASMMVTTTAPANTSGWASIPPHPAGRPTSRAWRWQARWSVGPSVTLFSPGDRVMAVVGGGAQATLAYVDESHTLSVPASMSWIEAGRISRGVLDRVRRPLHAGRLQMGARVLVSGAAGGVGTAGVQLAVEAGAHVTATVRRPRLVRDDVAALGAHIVIPPRGRVVERALRRRAGTGGAGEPGQRAPEPGAFVTRGGDRGVGCRRPYRARSDAPR